MVRTQSHLLPLDFAGPGREVWLGKYRLAEDAGRGSETYMEMGRCHYKALDLGATGWLQRPCWWSSDPETATFRGTRGTQCAQPHSAQAQGGLPSLIPVCKLWASCL